MREVRNGFLLSGLAGLLFGVAFVVVLLATGSPYALKGRLVFAVPAVTGMVSGAAGALGSYLDAVLERHGMKSTAQRRVLSFLAVALSTFGMAMAVALRYGLVAVQGHALWSMALGLGFGVAFAAVEYWVSKMRQRVLTLELENKYLSEIAKKDAALAKSTEDLVLAEERNRLARDLHDSVSSGIHGIVYGLHSLRQALTASEGGFADERVIGIIDLLEKTAQSTQDELRAMILELKPSLLDERGLTEALRMHCELFSQRQGIPVDLSLEDAPGLSPEQEVAVYRIAQEALTNVQRHSGASRVSLSLAQRDGEFVLTVTDNGSGFNPELPHSGVGLRSMEARCSRNGGVFRVMSSPGAGTTVEASFSPLE